MIDAGWPPLVGDFDALIELSPFQLYAPDIDAFPIDRRPSEPVSEAEAWGFRDGDNASRNIQLVYPLFEPGANSSLDNVWFRQSDIAFSDVVPWWQPDWPTWRDTARGYRVTSGRAGFSDEGTTVRLQIGATFLEVETSALTEPELLVVIDSLAPLTRDRWTQITRRH